MIKRFYRFLNPRFQTLFLEYPVNMVPRYTGDNPHPVLMKLVEKQRTHYEYWIQKALEYKDVFWEIPLRPNNSESNEPWWDNGYFPGLDLVMLYTMMAELKPSKYYEIGSGVSTTVAIKAIIEQNLLTEVHCIDPSPRSKLEPLDVHHHRVPLEKMELTDIRNLEAGDFLFVDNSHRLLPNSDVMVLFLDVLPYLASGVIVHIHDVYIPFDYPDFMCERFYSEQYALAINLIADPDRYVPIMANYFVSEDAELKFKLRLLWNHSSMVEVERHGGSFWMKIGTNGQNP